MTREKLRKLLAYGGSATHMKTRLCFANQSRPDVTHLLNPILDLGWRKSPAFGLNDGDMCPYVRPERGPGVKREQLVIPRDRMIPVDTGKNISNEQGLTPLDSRAKYVRNLSSKGKRTLSSV